MLLLEVPWAWILCKTNLHKEGGNDGLGIDEAGNTQVLDALVVKDGGASLEPGDVLCLA